MILQIKFNDGSVWKRKFKSLEIELGESSDWINIKIDKDIHWVYPELVVSVEVI